MNICLSMMMRNEASYLVRSLSSIRNHINSYLIVDTGSGDESIAIARQQLAGIPGEIVSRPWVNWGFNRSEAVTLAKANSDFVFLLDADEEYSGTGFGEPDPTIAYWIDVRYGSVIYSRPNLLPSTYDWKYVGVTHEYLMSPQNPAQGKLGGFLLTHPARTNKMAKVCMEDAMMLEEALKSEPDNSRYVFYLAQSYKDSGEADKAIEMYQKRATMGGWAEEVYISLLRIAQLSEGRKTFPVVAAAYTAAHEYRPQRAGETLRNFARYCNWWADGTLMPDDRLFVDASCYKNHK